MLYTTLTVKDTEYKLRLSAKSCIDLEKRLGENPVNVLAAIGDGQKVPKLDEILTIIHASMTQLNHGIDMDKMYEIYDAYIDEGHNMYELVAVILEVFKVSGLIPEVKDNAEKN